MDQTVPIIELRDLSYQYDDGDCPVVDHINLSIYDNEFITFLGPSGCGKTTTLRMIAGFEKPSGGEVVIDGKIYNDIPPYVRPVNTVFQRYALFPNMNVIQNVMVGLKNRPLAYVEEFFGGKEKIESEITASGKKVNYFTKKKYLNGKIYEASMSALKLVNMDAYASRKTDALSGGQQQRIAIARAIVNKPRILLLDEPLAALDLKLRERMQYELKEMQTKLGITFIYVTHDQTEAMLMSSRIAVMNDGHIQQLGTPKEIYDFPNNQFVARFVGKSNIYPGLFEKDAAHAHVTFLGTKFLFDDGDYPEFVNKEAVDVVIRPEDFEIVRGKGKGIHAKVISCVFKGEYYEIVVKHEEDPIVIRKYIDLVPGSDVTLTVEPKLIHIMKAASK